MRTGIVMLRDAQRLLTQMLCGYTHCDACRERRELAAEVGAYLDVADRAEPSATCATDGCPHTAVNFGAGDRCLDCFRERVGAAAEAG